MQNTRTKLPSIMITQPISQPGDPNRTPLEPEEIPPSGLEPYRPPRLTSYGTFQHVTGVSLGTECDGTLEPEEGGCPR